MNLIDAQAAIDLYEVVNAHTSESFAKLKAAGGKLAHYTTAENALNILNGRSIWLRNAALMNDFSEISFGKSCLVPALQQLQPRLDAILDSAHPGLAAEVINRLADVEIQVNLHTYLTSLAEFHEQDSFGKLSMWRAYGGPTAGVAILFNLEVFESASDELAVYLHRVLYGEREFRLALDGILDRLEQNVELLTRVPRKSAHLVIFHALQDLVLTTKHPAFHEEQEWRIIHSPHMMSSAFINEIPVSIGGVPQVVYPIELRDQPNLNMPLLELDPLIHRIVVGPCQYPQQICFAMSEALRRAQVHSPIDRIRVSNIPLRQRG